MSRIRHTTPAEVVIANIENREVEKLSERKDVNHNDRLNLNEATEVFTQYTGHTPGSLQELYAIFEPQHHITPDELNYFEANLVQRIAHEWKGDFHIKGYGDNPGYKPAGNFRFGKMDVHNRANPNAPQKTAILLADFNLMNLADFQNDVKGVTLVVSPTAFKAEEGANTPEQVDIGMALYDQEGYPLRNRFGQVYGHEPDKKLAVAQVPVEQLLDMIPPNGKELHAYLRIDRKNGPPVFVNPDGAAGRNFVIHRNDLAD